MSPFIIPLGLVVRRQQIRHFFFNLTEIFLDLVCGRPCRFLYNPAFDIMDFEPITTSLSG